jgi:peroxiredoxin
MGTITMNSALKCFANALSIAAIAWLATARTMGANPPAAETRVAKPAPGFELKDTKGKVVKLSDFAGKTLIVLFWATWDKPSQKQIHDLVELQRQYENQGFSVVGISLDSQGPDVVKAYVETNHVNFPVLMATSDVVQGFGGLDAIPTLFILEPHHNIISRHVGITDKSVIEDELKAIFTQVPNK